MRVVNNLQAMNSHRVWQNTSKLMEKSTSKLSSGMRINRAGDDAAGLAISEKMRGQVRGLSQASKNAQDAISLIQTAEGATQEIHAMLQRARELAVQAATDTNTADDRGKIQHEIDALVNQIDTISNNTEFNTIKLLDNSSSAMSEFSGIPQATLDTITSKVGGWLNDSLTLLRDNLGIALPDTPVKRDMTVTYYYSGADGAGASMGTANNGATLTLSFNLANLTDVNGDLIDNELMDRLVAHEMMHGLQFTEMAFSTDGSNPAGEIWFIEGLAMAIQGGVGFGAINGASTIGGAWTGTTQNYANAFAAVKTLHEITTGGLSAFIDVLEGGGDLDAAFAATTQGNSVEGGASQITNTGGDFANMASFITWFNGAEPDGYLSNSADFTGTGAITDASTQGAYTSVNSADTIPNGTGSALVETHFNLLFSNDAPSSKEAIVFQLGANEGQKLKFVEMNLTALNLGISTLSVGTSDVAAQAITKVDKAIEQVATTRALLGAYQNRIEHTIKNLDSAKENLQASESRIRDDDMASEMATFSKYQILSQAGQAMLAQANQSNQMVLALLR